MKEQSHQTKTIYDSPFNREFSTDAIHAGESKNMSATPIYQAATVDGQYLRSGNPTIDACTGGLGHSNCQWNISH